MEYIVMGDVTYIDTGLRMFERVIVHGYPTDRYGRRCRCHLDRAAQRIEMSDTVPEGERNPLTCRLIESELGVTSTSLVPYVGKVRADGSPS